jgi:hypothetical protein
MSALRAENVTGDESVAGTVGQMAQAGQVFGVHGGACFDFDADHPAVRCFQDGVDLRDRHKPIHNLTS